MEEGKERKKLIIGDIFSSLSILLIILSFFLIMLVWSENEIFGISYKYFCLSFFSSFLLTFVFLGFAIFFYLKYHKKFYVHYFISILVMVYISIGMIILLSFDQLCWGSFFIIDFLIKGFVILEYRFQLSFKYSQKHGRTKYEIIFDDAEYDQLRRIALDWFRKKGYQIIETKNEISATKEWYILLATKAERSYFVFKQVYDSLPNTTKSRLNIEMYFYNSGLDFNVNKFVLYGFVPRLKGRKELLGYIEVLDLTFKDRIKIEDITKKNK